MKRKFYGMLMQFTHDTHPCREHLSRRYSAELVDEALNEGLISQLRTNDSGDPVYYITEKGKEVRDK